MGGTSTLSDLGFQPQTAQPQAPAAPHPLADLGFKPAQQSAHPLADLGFKPVATPAPTPSAAPAGNTISPHTPGTMEQLRGMVANSAIGTSLEQAMPKVADALNLHPSETVNSPTYEQDQGQLLAPQYAARGAGKQSLDLKHSGFEDVAKGVGEAAGGLTTPGMMAAAAIPVAEGAAVFGETGMKLIPRLVSGGFSLDMLHGLYQKYAPFREAMHQGDYAKARELAGQALIEGPMAALTAHHAVHGGPHAVPPEEKPVLHDSNDVEELRASAERQAPKIGDAAAAAAKGVDGAKLEAVRDSKDTDRITDKAERQGVEPNQIADIAAAKITVPDQAAADKVLANLHEQMPVESVNGSLNEPGKNGVRQVQAVVNTGAEGEPVKRAEVLIQTPEMAAATAKTHDDYREAQELRADGKDTEADALEAKITREHEAAASQTKGEGKSPEPAAGGDRGVAPAAETKPKYDFGNTQTNIPHDSDAGQALAAAREAIDPNDLRASDFGGNSKGLETEPHVTVRYGIQGEDTAGIEKYLRSQPPFEAKLGKLSSFPPNKNTEGAAVLKADVDAPDLHRMNAEIHQHGDFKESDFPDYKPHATVAYVKPEAVDKYVGLNHTDGKTFQVRSVNISDRAGNLKEIPLQGSPKLVDRPGEFEKLVERAKASGIPLTEEQAVAAKTSMEAAERGDDDAALDAQERYNKLRSDDPRLAEVKAAKGEYSQLASAARQDSLNHELGAKANAAYQQWMDAEAKAKTKTPAMGNRPAVGGHDGRATEVLTPTRRMPSTYRLVEAADLTPSHNAQTFEENADYPKGVQERDYKGSKEAQSRVIQQAQSYDPAYTVNTNPDAVNGPPVVTPDGTVLGGNSRAMSTQRLYAEGNGDKYRETLKRDAATYGLTPEHVDGMKQPVLVRQIERPGSVDDARRIGSELNKSMTGALGVSERAVSAGKNLKPETLRTVADMMQQDDSSLRELLSRRGPELLRMMTADGAITERERPQFVDAASGGLSEEGKTFFERALMGSVIDDPRLMNAAPKSILGKLERSLGSIASFGSRPDEWNLLPALRQAVAEHAAIEKNGSTVDLHLNQRSMFGPERNPVVDALVRTLDEKPNAVRSKLEQFSKDADQNPHGQTKMFGGGDAYDAFNHAFGSKLTDEEYHNANAQILRTDPAAERKPEAAKARDAGVPQRAAGEQAQGGGAGDGQPNRAPKPPGTDDAGLRSTGRPAELKAPKPPGAVVKDAGGNEHVVPDWMASRLPKAPKPPAIKPDEGFKPGRQSTPVQVRDADGNWQPGTLDYYHNGANGTPQGRGRVTLASGDKIHSVAAADMKSAPQTAKSRADIGIDFDGTLAKDTGNRSLGAALPERIESVKKMLAEGKSVEIITRRVENDPTGAEAKKIQDWLEEQGLPRLSVTDQKTAGLLYDDNAHHAPSNENTPLEPHERVADVAPGGEHGKEASIGARAEQLGAGEVSRGTGAGGGDRGGDGKGSGTNADVSARTSTTVGAGAEGKTTRDKPTERSGDIRRQQEPGQDVESKANEARSAQRKEQLDAAVKRTQRENAANHKSEVVEVAGHKALVLDPDGEGVWHRLFRKIKDVNGKNPLGAGANWTGMSIDKTGVNTALAYLHGATGDLDASGMPDGGAKAGYERLAKLLKDARNEQGGATILRGDYRADTAREEATHQWQREHGLDRSEAMREVASRPEFVEAADQLRSMGYEDATPGEVADEMMAKAMAGDPDFKITDEQREDLVRSFLTEVVEEKGPAVLKNLPQTDPRLKDIVSELQRGYDYGEQYDQRDESGGGPPARGGDGQAGREAGQRDDRPRETLRDTEKRGDGEGGQQRVPKAGTAEGELKPPEKQATKGEKTTGSNEPVFQRPNEDEHPLFQKVTDEENPVARSVSDLVDDLKKLPKADKGTALDRVASWTKDTVEDSLTRSGKALGGVPSGFEKAFAWAKATTAALVHDYQNPIEQTDWKTQAGQMQLSQTETALRLQDLAKELKAQAPKPLDRIAMTHWMEAAGSEAKLKEWHAGAKARAMQAIGSDRARYLREAQQHYDTALNLTPEQKTLALRLRQHFNDTLDIAKKNGLLEFGYRNYVMHLYEKADAANILHLVDTSELNPDPSFIKKRFHDTFYSAEGAGLTPKSKDIGYLLTAYDKSMNEAISSRNFMRSLLDAKAPDGRPIAAIKTRGGWVIAKDSEAPEVLNQRERPKSLEGYRDFDRPQLRNFLFKPTTEDLEGFDPKLFEEDPEKLAFRGDLIIHPKYASRVEDMLTPSWFERGEGGVQKLGSAIVKGSALAKEMMTAVAPFHMVQEGVHGMEHKVNPFKLPKIDLTDKTQRLLASHGLTLTNYDAEGLFGTKALKGIGEFVPGLNKAMDAMQSFSQWQFQDYIPRLKMSMANEAFERNVKRYPNLSEEQVAELTAKQSNAAFGNLNTTFDSIPRTKTFKTLLRLATFAPDFLESRMRFVGQAFTKYGGEQRAALIRGALAMYTVARVTNALMNNGDAKWDAEHAFSIVRNGRSYSLRTVQGDILHAVTDPRGFIYNRLNPLTTRPIVEFLSGRDQMGRQKSALSEVKDLGKSTLPFGLQKIIQTPDEDWLNSILTSTGLESKNYRTPTEETVHKLYIAGIPDMKDDEEKQAETRKMRGFEDKVRSGHMTPADVWKLVEKGEITPKEAGRTVQRAQKSRLQIEFSGLHLKDAIDVYAKATPLEQAELKPQFARKQAAIADLPEAQREKTAEKMQELLAENQHK